MLSQAKSPPQANLRAWLGPAFFGLAWPGFWPQAEAGTSLDRTRRCSPRKYATQLSTKVFVWESNPNIARSSLKAGAYMANALTRLNRQSWVINSPTTVDGVPVLVCTNNEITTDKMWEDNPVVWENGKASVV
ncbi:uncharacterized protein LACBIDRAFT_333735 [Laccaria bicolor S238N-H82]|uniref:Predicted protein n=1 Tax=Laccaria bicolor (strain S238N-H82 / ATCC MYA-4686) TaxID=486041 RepID=B0DWW4_LACBS|nr:uncharacterized protein LACBIDRAFT_333735 [Laccaria bicolor S238N-H82]EDR00831.1 predicted protein [Laccaria bicolor S238N-H82]|eukprot:XP_001888425.1 predicted protein [Laccaria bicolor S238N-H82]